MWSPCTGEHYCKCPSSLTAPVGSTAAGFIPKIVKGAKMETRSNSHKQTEEKEKTLGGIRELWGKFFLKINREEKIVHT
jgi:hypothetical protein